jgi:hypothetical protein
VETSSSRLVKEDSVMHIAPRKDTPTEDAHPPFCAGRKLSDIDQIPPDLVVKFYAIDIVEVI